jgi:outer membrane receptor for ferrienterochelin and colicins
VAALGFRLALLAGAACLIVAPAPAETRPDPVSAKRVYAPADFTRFAPKTAYDMLTEVPGFAIQTVDTSVRGLGQASENVLINGQRVANKLGAVDQLQRTPASSVARIEIVDAASLGVAGLTGQVANVILNETKKASGQFEYDANARAHFAKPEFLGGSVSYSGKEGPVDYTFSVANGYGRGAIGGPILILDPNRALIETRNEVSHNEFEQANMQAKFGIDGPGSSVGNLILGYAPYWSPSHLRDTRVEADGELRHRTDVQDSKGYVVDINGDYEFALGPGRLKLIGLDHWEHNPLVDTQILFFDTTGADPQGGRFVRDQRPLEVIGRAEYHWKARKNDWQVSFERAFNSLAQVGRLFDLEPDGSFIEVPFPSGTGTVREIRYEGLATFSRSLTSKIDLQAVAGAETSTLGLVGGAEPPGKFFRPKGSIVLGWHPEKGWNISLKLRRRVGQIDFADFLSQAILTQNRTNAGNVNLVPPQSWEVETDFAHDLGRWGKTDLTLHYYSVSDIIDFIRIGEDGQGVGNLPHADRLGFQSTSTFLLDALGWRGAKLDATFAAEWTRVKDPLTGRPRPISGIKDHSAFLQLRNDIPYTPFAWSAYIQNRHFVSNYLLTEIDQTLDIPWLVGFYLEDKNVLGTTVRFTVDNVFNGRHLEFRQVFTGFRDRAPIAFIEHHDELVGPIFTLSVKGNF